VEGIDMVEERPSKNRPEVEAMDMVDNMITEVDMEVIEREHEGMVFAKH
jgi:hypothetical protein